ncbi:MAG: hypothetical protein M3454_08550 [Actinomycetota bacterium]|nr:hypothetical protein [Actinomycetota bacterium]
MNSRHLSGRFWALALVIALGTSGSGGAALAKRPTFGPGLDDLALYAGQSFCSPAPKPGVLAFQRAVYARHPGTGSLGISRACNIGGRSEHKEGRAWDWAVNAAVPWQRRAARDVIDWLLEADRFGNPRARARRFGIMYLIWDKRIWLPWSGWRNYCKMRNGVCWGSDGTARHPHTNHVHFSFTWPGARRNTTWWHPRRSLVSALASEKDGYWVMARNGSVIPYSSGYFGARSDRPRKRPVVGAAATPTGKGYWLLSRNGAVKAFGDARYRGGARKYSGRAVTVAPTPTGKGYWILARGGRVIALGDADHFGGMRGSGSRWTDLALTPTGAGYLLFSAAGGVAAFGDATQLGDALDAGLDSPVTAGIAHGADGYWLVTERGRILSFGDAPDLEPLGLAGANAALVDAAATRTGAGLWLAGERGKIYERGDAPALRNPKVPARRIDFRLIPEPDLLDGERLE